MRAPGAAAAPLQSVHVAGTNGKGSTSAMLGPASCKRRECARGSTLRRTWCVSERIRLDGVDISDADFAATFTRVPRSLRSYWPAGGWLRTPPISNVSPPWPLSAFCLYKSDIAVSETGMGGRLDSTNVVFPQGGGHHSHRFRSRKFSRPFHRTNRRGKRPASSSRAGGWSAPPST